jgi:hypothetical protein
MPQIRSLLSVSARQGLLCAAGTLLLTGAARAADPAPFDLNGPGLRITVTRGEATLPIAQVPSLAEGDRIRVMADFPTDQRARFLLVSAFLQGATNPPAKDWVRSAEPWKKKDKDRQLDLEVPKGARQLVLFLVPESGGALGAISDAVRGRPGEFVRATQDLNQASLDRARLDAFMTAIRTQENSHPEYLRSVAPVLARSLSMKLNEDCLGKVIESQAACLLEHREALVLADVHTSSLTETLAGAPVDLALQLSSTREAGMGYYSPYIGVIRDIARVFGAFSNPQLDYLPSLTQRQGTGVALLLNAAPSFAKPRSVLVAGMPAIEANSPPRLRAALDRPLCGARPDLLLPVDGAPLIYATDYLREMKLRIEAPGGTVDVPVRPRADKGGYMIDGPVPAGLSGKLRARLHGLWGFDPFEGPEFRLEFPTAGEWRIAGEPASLVSGRDNPLELEGPSPACVASVTVRRGNDQPLAVGATVTDAGRLALTLPLKDVRPGQLTLEFRQLGGIEPASLAVRAYAQASRLDGLLVHAGDRFGTLSGQRLDQVAGASFAERELRPLSLRREGDIDRLTLVAEDGAALEDVVSRARVRLKDGRSLPVSVSFEAPRPGVSLLQRTLKPGRSASGIALAIKGEQLLPDTGQMVFSARVNDGPRLTAKDRIEIASADEDVHVDLPVGPDLQIQGNDIVVAVFDPAKLGPAAFGPLQFRLVRETGASDWQPLATLARLPRITSVDCAPGGECVVKGERLFLIETIGSGKGKPLTISEGFTGDTIRVPRPAGDRLALRLRDAPGEEVTLPLRAPPSAAVN